MAHDNENNDKNELETNWIGNLGKKETKEKP